MMRGIILLLGLTCSLGLQLASAQGTEKVERAIKFIQRACVAGGEKVEIQTKGKAGLTIRQWKDAGISGEVTFTKKELEGFVDEFTELSAQQATEMRQCMQPYIDRILDAILGPEAHRTEKEACVQFAGTIPESKQRALAEAKKQALSEFYGEFVRAKSQTKDFKFDSSLISSVAIGIVRVQGSPEYYNGKSLGEVCTKATFFITEEDTEQMKPQTAQLENYCVTDETLPLPKLMEAFQFRSQRAALSHINPQIKEASDIILMTLTTDTEQVLTL